MAVTAPEQAATHGRQVHDWRVLRESQTTTTWRCLACGADRTTDDRRVLAPAREWWHNPPAAGPCDESTQLPILSEEELTRLGTLAAKATPGPWERSRYGPWITTAALRNHAQGDIFQLLDGTQADLDFTVAALTAAPSLVADLKRMRAAAEAVEQLHQQVSWFGIPVCERCLDLTDDHQKSLWPCLETRTIRGEA